MLANHRIKFLDLHFFWHGALVLAGRVVMTSASAGYELDFLSHN